MEHVSLLLRLTQAEGGIRTPTTFVGRSLADSFGGSSEICVVDRDRRWTPSHPSSNSQAYNRLDFLANHDGNMRIIPLPPVQVNVIGIEI